jgi:hypothetical protein
VYEPAIEHGLLGDCRTKVPDVTEAEIAELIDFVAPRAKANMSGFLLTAVPNACQPDAVKEIRRQRHEIEEAKLRQRERDAENVRWLEALEALDHRTEVAWTGMPPDEKLDRLRAVKRILKNGPNWNRLTEDGRDREAEVQAKAALRKELAAVNDASL